MPAGDRSPRARSCCGKRGRLACRRGGAGVRGRLRSAGYRLDLAAPGAPEIDRADNGFSFTLEVASTKLRVLFVEGTHAKRSVGGDGHFINDMELMTRAWEESGEIEHTSLTALDSFVLDASNLFGVSFSNGEMAIDTGVRFPGAGKMSMPTT
ncbi:MAG: hypothetical protein R3F11_02915 [Verrucomicrobiales bacterium]